MSPAQRALDAVRRVRDRRASDESGFSLVELLVYTLFIGVIFALAGGMLISALSAQGQVTGYTQAADAGQLIARSVEEGVRNASGAAGEEDAERIDGIRAEPMLADNAGQLLRARVAIGANDGTVQWECQAWFYSAPTESVYFARSTAGAVPDPGQFEVTADGRHVADNSGGNWLLLGSGVRLPADAPEFFGTSGGGRVVLRFEVARDNVSLVLIPNTVVARKPTLGGEGPTSCF